MFTLTDPHELLAVAHERVDRLHAEADVERLFRSSPTRRALASTLCRAADRIDRTPTVWRTAIGDGR